VTVYVPNAELAPFAEGPACESCSELFTAPVASAFTDSQGRFTIEDMPEGVQIPLVVQVGKWRMQYTLSRVAHCVSNDAAALAGGASPRRRDHVEGDRPSIAVSRGADDPFECLSARRGVAGGESPGAPAGAGRIPVFTGGDGATGGAATRPPSPAS